MSFKIGDKVVVVKDGPTLRDIGVHEGDMARVLGMSATKESLYVYFDKWDGHAPYSACSPGKIAKMGKPYYVLRAYRFKNVCMFEGGDAYKEGA